MFQSPRSSEHIIFSPNAWLSMRDLCDNFTKYHILAKVQNRRAKRNSWNICSETVLNPQPSLLDAVIYGRTLCLENVLYKVQNLNQCFSTDRSWPGNGSWKISKGHGRFPTGRRTFVQKILMFALLTQIFLYLTTKKLTFT